MKETFPPSFLRGRIRCRLEPFWATVVCPLPDLYIWLKPSHLSCRWLVLSVLGVVSRVLLLFCESPTSFVREFCVLSVTVESLFLCGVFRMPDLARGAHSIRTRACPFRRATLVRNACNWALLLRSLRLLRLPWLTVPLQILRDKFKPVVGDTITDTAPSCPSTCICMSVCTLTSCLLLRVALTVYALAFRSQYAHAMPALARGAHSCHMRSCVSLCHVNVS